MHPDEVDVDSDLVHRLVAEQFPQWATLPIQPVYPRGTDNALFRLGEDMVARLPRLPRTVITLEKERHWLPRLAPHLPLAVPTPLADAMPADGYPFPWSIYRWLPGESLTVDRAVDKQQLALDLATFLAALQRIDPAGGPPPGEHNFFRGEPIARRDTAVREAIEALRDEIDVELVTAVWEETLHAPNWHCPPVWIHGDLDSRNLLARNGRLSAVIDFGGLGVGDPACDVMVAWKVLASDSREIFRSALAIGDATWTRARGWALSQALGALSYYTMDTNPTLVLDARRWLPEVLAEGRAHPRRGKPM